MFGSFGAPEMAVLFLLAFGTLAYFLPTFIAAVRGKSNVLPILALNLLLGWSVIGWVVALVWALSTQVVDRPAPPAPRPMPVGPSRTCPFCAELVQAAAIVCKHCGRDLPVAQA